MDYPCENCVKLSEEGLIEQEPVDGVIIQPHEIIWKKDDGWIKLECTECGQVRFLHFVKNLEENSV
jgi:uncharacterized Zn finger protein